MKKGFTLIELLAVIVILAIIALIATPIVLDIINDAKESAILRSADFYLDGAELAIAQSILKNIQISDGRYSIMQDGNICIGTLANNTCTGDILKVEVNGEKPTSGTIIIRNGQINDITLKLSDKVIVKNAKGELVFGQLSPGLYDENDNLIYTWDELLNLKTVYYYEEWSEELFDYYEVAVEIPVLTVDEDGTLNGGLDESGFVNRGAEKLVGKLVIDNRVTRIGWYAFGGCSGLKEVIIPDSVTEICDGAFVKCSSLKEVIIPNSVTTIGIESFRYCTKLEEIIIPDSVTEIYEYAFSNCTNLTSIKIGSGVLTIYSLCDEGCPNLSQIIVDKNNPKYDSRNNSNALIETATNTLIKGCKNTKIPDSVTSIGAGAFYDCANLTSIEIPDSVTSIGSSAFYGCTSLTSIEIPDSVTSIGYSAFEGCTSLTNIEIPDSVTSIEFWTFIGCTNLTSIKIGSGVTSIDSSAFDGTNLASIVIDENNKVYDSRENSNAIIESETNTLIKGCKNTKIPSTATNIGNYAFSGCTSLTEIIIPEGVENIGECAFEGSKITSITIPSSVTNVGYAAFGSSQNLTSAKILNSEIHMDNAPFENCNNLTTIYFKGTANVEDWGAPNATVITDF